MANIKKIQVNGIEYEVYDEAAHKLINKIRSEMPANLAEDAQGRIILVDKNGNPIGEGIFVSANIDDLVLEQKGNENKLFLAYQGETIGNGVVLPTVGISADAVATESDTEEMLNDVFSGQATR